MNPAPMQAVLAAIDHAARPETRIQSRMFGPDSRQTAYIVTGNSAAAVQRAVADIMESVPNGRADFTMPILKERRAHLQTWEAKGIVERAE